MKWQNVEDTTWPCDEDGELQWALRYGNEESVMLRRMSAASIVHSYAYLTDPTLTQTSAIAALKRARTAVRLSTQEGPK